MTANKRAARKPEEIERAHNAVATKNAALDITTATMLLGILAGTVEARHAPPTIREGDHPNDSNAAAPPVPASDDETSTAANADAVEHERPTAHESSIQLPDASANLHATATAGASIDVHLPADNNSQVQSDVTLSLDAEHVHVDLGAAASLEMPPTVSDSSGANAAEGHLPSLATDISATISTTLDASLATLSNTITAVTGEVQHLVSNLPSLGNLTDAITATATDLTQSTLSAPNAAVGVLVSSTLDGHAESPPPLLDTSGLMPVGQTMAPLHIGFMGQPQPDGHDTHDGAFSALGLHHF